MLKTQDIILRDFQQSDIEKRIYWETVETEWQQWDGPWEYEGMSEVERQTELEHYVSLLRQTVENVQTLSPDAKRLAFQIDTNTTPPRYIGWVTSYRIDENFLYSDSETVRCTVGIDIPDRTARGKGYAYQAMCLFIRYLRNQGEHDIYTQTWSGNLRMIHIAEKLGFEECCRKKNFRTVRGKYYDGLTFQLNWDKFLSFSSQIL